MAKPKQHVGIMPQCNVTLARTDSHDGSTSSDGTTEYLNSLRSNLHDISTVSLAASVSFLSSLRVYAF